tara:strand:+ start:187 stop:1053 length:867 start_codon:yes stop_codon:yes gene_type:complete
MKLRNILITAAAAGMMLASADRAGVVGYTAGDYTDMNTYAHKAAGQNVAYTAGNDFTAVWTDGGTTWGFSGGTDTQLVDMLWSNGTYGLSVGLDMPAGGDTTFDLGFGMNLMGWDVGFSMDTVENGPMSLNARGGCGFWAFDTMTFSYNSGTSTADYTVLDLGMYGVHNWGAATGMFGMGVTSTDMPNADWVDPATLINTSFSVESTLTDWCDLRIGYNKSFNMSAGDSEATSTDSYSAGLGFNYGSVALDMTISDATLNAMVSNPLQYVNGRNDAALAASWTLSYTW